MSKVLGVRAVINALSPVRGVVSASTEQQRHVHGLRQYNNQTASIRDDAQRS